jgi:hypothetical protein
MSTTIGDTVSLSSTSEPSSDTSGSGFRYANISAFALADKWHEAGAVLGHCGACMPEGNAAQLSHRNHLPARKSALGIWRRGTHTVHVENETRVVSSRHWSDNRAYGG